MYRFIPACAGNTASEPILNLVTPVHPRVCGEHPMKICHECQAIGSSPRVRGTRRSAGSRIRSHRFIPACAGNTRRSASTPRTAPVHPRVCGEHSIRCNLQGQDFGSSPRVRGTLLRWRKRAATPWFIPACAGNTARRFSVLSSLPVHPRVCGEHSSIPSIGLPTRRFIPACAGNTGC